MRQEQRACLAGRHKLRRWQGRCRWRAHAAGVGKRVRRSSRNSANLCAGPVSTFWSSFTLIHIKDWMFLFLAFCGILLHFVYSTLLRVSFFYGSRVCGVIKRFTF
jgi:hypothetical protein